MSNSIFLLPGEMHFAKDGAKISTLLGSCVAVVLHHPAKKWGGMNHFMLPNAQTGNLPPGKCGDQATAMLIKLATMSGCVPTELQAMVIGGGKVTGHLSMGTSTMVDVGDRNVEAARTALKLAGIRIARTDIGGSQGRKLAFDPATGELVVQLIPQSASTVASAAKGAELRSRKARVLIVDDSATVRGLLRQAIAGSPDLEVCGEAEDPYAARELMLQGDPDVICLDIIMPKLDGLSFLKRLMAYKPVPTVIVSTIAKQGSDMHKKVMEAGAVGVIDKEDLKIYQGVDVCRQKLLPILKRAATTVVTKIG